MADKAEFLQAIDDAILDADSLEKFINGSDSETVLTRLSAQYPTLQKALKELFTRVGVAERFKTLSALQASPLSNGSYAIVADDVEVKNGIYIKDNGAWVKSKYDPAQKAMDYTDSRSMGEIKPYAEVVYITDDDRLLPTTKRLSTVYYTRVREGDFLRIPPDPEGTIRIFLYEYDLEKNRVKGAVIVGSSVDKYIPLNDGYVRYSVTRNGLVTDLPASDIELFKSEIYISYNKLNRDYQEVKSLPDFKLREKLSMEVGEITRSELGVDQSGSIASTGKLTTAYDFLSFYRSRRHLKVINLTDIEFEFDDGNAVLYEYNEAFKCIAVTDVLNGEPKILERGTKYIKLALSDLSNPDPEVFVSFYSDSERGEYVLNPHTPNRTWGAISFSYEVNTNQGRQIINDASATQYTEDRYFNTGSLKLPPNYNPFGEAVRLIIFVQGSGGYLGIHNSTASNAYESHITDEGIFNYWLNEGYALLFVYPFTSKYTVKNAINQGSPTAMAAYVQAYKWVIENFNIAKDGVFVSGKSSGGYCGALLSYNMGIPVLATGLLAPVISPMREPFGAFYDIRRAYVDDFGFVGDHSVLEEQAHTPIVPRTEALFDYMRQNADKLIGYNPWWCGVTNRSMEELIEAGVDQSELDPELEKNMTISRVCPVPLKIWCAPDDTTGLAYNQSKIYVKTIRNAGGNAELREMPVGTGGHMSVDIDEKAIKIPELKTKLGIIHKNVPLAIAETVSYFRRFE